MCLIVIAFLAFVFVDWPFCYWDLYRIRHSLLENLSPRHSLFSAESNYKSGEQLLLYIFFFCTFLGISFGPASVCGFVYSRVLLKVCCSSALAPLHTSASVSSRRECCLFHTAVKMAGRIGRPWKHYYCWLAFLVVGFSLFFLFLCCCCCCWFFFFTAICFALFCILYCKYRRGLFAGHVNGSAMFLYFSIVYFSLLYMSERVIVYLDLEAQD